MAKFDKDIEDQLAMMVVDSEYQTARQNQKYDKDDFESYVDLFDAEHTEREYEWMSDIFIPEFPTQMLTQSAIDVSQYFQTREFVDVFIEDGDEQAQLSAQASKELINRTLNRRKLYHYIKYVRGKTLNHLNGHVDIECWWEQDSETEYDIDGFGEIKEEFEVTTKDYFNYAVLDPRNVFTDKAYAYSMQEREWVIIREEKTLEKLKADEETFQYFNLDLLEELAEKSQEEKTDTYRETIEEEINDYELPPRGKSVRFDILKRYGKFWTVNGKDGKALPGIDGDGKVKDNAYLAEIMMSFAVKGSTKVLIQFHHTPYIDANGDPYRPIIRGLCYIHPTKDGGVGDGKYSRELQIGINDTFNVSNDRTMLATMPTLKGKAYSMEDMSTVRIQPNHLIELQDPKDLEEMVFSDNTQMALSQMSLLTGKMNQATSIFPTTMGSTPEYSSTTATAVAGADQRTNQRTNYKAMTFEYTMLTELYWMIQQMTWAFAKPETGFKLMGEKVFDFDPTLDYTFKPLSQSIETAAGKEAKIKNWMTLLGYIVNVQHPDIVNIINMIVAKVAVLMGDEYEEVAAALLNPGVPANPPDVQQGAPGGGGASNQYGIEQGATEQMARGLQV